MKMKRKFSALSIVASNAMRIAQGMKTLEVRSWQPEQLPLKDLLIVENKPFLNHTGAEELGVAVAWSMSNQFTSGNLMKLKPHVHVIGRKVILLGNCVMFAPSRIRLQCLQSGKSISLKWIMHNFYCELIQIKFNLSCVKNVKI